MWLTTLAETRHGATGRLRATWRQWRFFLLFVAVTLVFRSAVADLNQIPSASMRPSLLEGDRIVVDKLAYGLRVPFTLVGIHNWRNPARGDVVTFISPRDERLLVKRVLGVPGDVVELRNNHLIVNYDTATYEPLAARETASLGIADRQRYEFFRERLAGMSHIIMLSPDREDADPAYATFGPVTVPAGQYLMLGDNRDASADFRWIRFVDRARVLGRANRVAFSLDYDDHWLPRVDRFLLGLN